MMVPQVTTLIELPLGCKKMPRGEVTGPSVGRRPVRRPQTWVRRNGPRTARGETTAEESDLVWICHQLTGFVEFPGTMFAAFDMLFRCVCFLLDMLSLGLDGVFCMGHNKLCLLSGS